jgi:hypothetical protein
MANLQFNTRNIRRTPIKRNNLFYSENDFQYETEIGMNYLEQDVNQTVILYEVDLSKTNTDVIYGETKSNSVVFKTPVELHVIYEIEEGELSSYDKTKNLGTYVKNGKLRFYVYQNTLDEMGAEIKVGDYVGVQINPTQILYYVVTNDGRNNFDNQHTVFGYMSNWRSITCAYVNENEFNGN